MGKYMRKGKGVGEVAVMEVSTQSGSLGVRTRARALASSQKSEHKRLVSRSGSCRQQQHSRCCLESSSSMQQQQLGSCYMELRSRRLEKIPPRCSCYHSHGDESKSLQEAVAEVAEPPDVVVASEDATTLLGSDGSLRQQKQQSSVAHSRNNSTTFSQSQSLMKPTRARRNEQQQSAASEADDDGIEAEASFGENIMDQDSKERKTRETTPSSDIRGIETMEAPGSSNRPPPPTTRRRLQQQQQQEEIAGNRYRTRGRSRHFHVPTLNEIEEFFAGAEQEEQRRFTERYNYDPVSDSPLPGRYEWIRLRP